MLYIEMGNTRVFGVWYTNCLQICDKNAGFDLEQAEIVSNYIHTVAPTFLLHKLLMLGRPDSFHIHQEGVELQNVAHYLVHKNCNHYHGSCKGLLWPMKWLCCNV